MAAKRWWERLFPIFGKRQYEGAKYGGHVWGGPQAYASPSLDVDLAVAREPLRRRSRHAYQNSASARAIVESLVALIASSGIDIDPDSGSEKNDDALREQWELFVETADASGRLDLWELQRQALRSLSMAGEFIWQIVNIDDPMRPFPFAILALEPDQLSETPVAPVAAGNDFTAGVECDRYGRPKFYHILSQPADQVAQPLGGTLLPQSGGAQSTNFTGGQATRGERIPAERIIHGFEQQRPGQTRGEPWLAPLLTTLHQERQLVDAELTSAKIGAAPAIAIKTAGSGFPDQADPNYTGSNAQAQRQYDFTPGAIAVLGENESVEVIRNERPSQLIAQFRNMLRGDLAGAGRIPQRYIDRDVSRANYSSMRADMLDTRRLLDPVQNWFGRLVAQEVYRRVFPQLATGAGLAIPRDGTPERRRMERCKVHPDGWAYVDPQKDLDASKSAIDAGLSNYTDEIQRRGGDVRAVWKKLKADRDRAAAMGLDLTPPEPPAAAPAAEAAPVAAQQQSAADAEDAKA